MPVVDRKQPPAAVGGGAAASRASAKKRIKLDWGFDGTALGMTHTSDGLASDRRRYFFPSPSFFEIHYQANGARNTARPQFRPDIHLGHLVYESGARSSVRRGVRVSRQSLGAIFDQKCELDKIKRQLRTRLKLFKALSPEHKTRPLLAGFSHDRHQESVAANGSGRELTRQARARPRPQSQPAPWARMHSSTHDVSSGVHSR
jgi:hypothetical protein